jgi:site-specific DNA-methyltransferase (adenine-specific)
MNKEYLNKILNADCIKHLSQIDANSVDLFLSDIPYGININEWDVLHNNTNSALLGTSPAQIGKTGFKRRGKPINGWSSADRNIGKEYQHWCFSWSKLLFPIMKEGASLFVFGARRTIHHVINAFEESGFLLKDILAWKKPSAHHRAQKLNIVLAGRGLKKEQQKWEGWRLGNLAPIYEPIAWFFKPYKITITDNILKYEVGAINIDACKINGSSPENLLEFGFTPNEKKIHEAQKPLSLIEFLIKLTTRENQIILDPFMGSGTTALAAINLNRKFIGFENNTNYYNDSLLRLKNAYNIKYDNYKEYESSKDLTLFDSSKSTKKYLQKTKKK